jgi:hypothetical protein
MPGKLLKSIGGSVLESAEELQDSLLLRMPELPLMQRLLVRPCPTSHTIKLHPCLCPAERGTLANRVD